MYVSWCIVMCYSCKIIILYDQFQVVQVIWYQSDSDFRMSWMKSTVIENTKYICNPLSRHLIMHYPIIWWFDGSLGWLVVFNVPSTARSFRDGTPIYCPLRRTWSSINTPFRPGFEPRAVAWQSITLPLRYASSTRIVRKITCMWNWFVKGHNRMIVCDFEESDGFGWIMIRHTNLIGWITWDYLFSSLCKMHYGINRRKIVCDLLERKISWNRVESEQTWIALDYVPQVPYNPTL